MNKLYQFYQELRLKIVDYLISRNKKNLKSLLEEGDENSPFPVSPHISEKLFDLEKEKTKIGKLVQNAN